MFLRPPRGVAAHSGAIFMILSRGCSRNAVNEERSGDRKVEETSVGEAPHVRAPQSVWRSVWAKGSMLS